MNSLIGERQKKDGHLSLPSNNILFLFANIEPEILMGYTPEGVAIFNWEILKQMFEEKHELTDGKFFGGIPQWGKDVLNVNQDSIPVYCLDKDKKVKVIFDFARIEIKRNGNGISLFPVIIDFSQMEVIDRKEYNKRKGNKK